MALVTVLVVLLLVLVVMFLLSIGILRMATLLMRHLFQPPNQMTIITIRIMRRRITTSWW